MERPSGTATFLFTDIEGSTRLWEDHPDQMGVVLAKHDRILGEVIEDHGGQVFSTAGDAFAAGFLSAIAAVEAAIAVQTRTGGLVAGGEPVRMRVAVHAGEVEARDGGFFGPVLNRCARIRDAAHGGQILMSLAAEELLADRLPEQVSLLDLGEHRLRDLSRLEHVFQICHPDLNSEFPPLRSLAGMSTNLPIQVTSFVGRVQESAELEKLIRGSRLVTVTGAGGCGKSRLTVQVAAEILGEFPDGVWLVELASLTDSELVDQTVASLFGVRERPNITLVESIVGYLQPRNLLVIVDNCEHLIDPIADLVAYLLAHSDGVRVVATSREPLRIRGEAIYQLPALPVPESDDDWDTLRRTDSVRLFAERAEAAAPGFRVTHTNAQAVANICTHLDGIPLAIELAASASRLLSPDQINDHLDDRFRLLTGGARDDLAHHRTLGAAIDWSYQLLTPHQQALFARLAVFEGGLTLEGAEEVCAYDPLDTGDILPLLAALVDRSLVVAVPGATDDRYRLLETIRAFASNQLGGDPVHRLRHARHYLSLAERLGRLLTTDRTAEAVAGYSADLANLRTALDFLAHAGRAAEYCRLLIAMRRFLWIRRMYTEADHHFRRAREIMSDDLDPSSRGLILMGAALSIDQGHGANLTASVDLLHQSASLLTEAGDNQHLAETLSLLGLVEDAAFHDQALEVATRSGNQNAMAFAHHYFGCSAFGAGDLQTALEQFGHALNGFQASNLQAFAQIWKANVLHRLGDTEAAMDLADQALKTFEEIEDFGGIDDCYALRCEVLLAKGSTNAAHEAFQRCIEIKNDYFGGLSGGSHAVAAHASVLVADITESIEHLRLIRTATIDEVFMEDMLDHAFFAIARLALHEQNPAVAATALAAQATYATTHGVIPNQPRQDAARNLAEQVKAQLDSEVLNAARHRGITMTLDDIIHLALDRYGRG